VAEITQGIERPDSAGDTVGYKPITGPTAYIQIGTASGLDLGIQQYVKGAMVDLSIDKIAYAELYVKNLNVQLVDDLSWAEGQIMRIFLGYTHDVSSIGLQGKFAMSRPRFEFKGRDLIVIGAFGDGIEMTRVAKRRVFENMTYGQVVERIASEYGYEPLVSKSLREVVPSITQAGISDYEFVHEIASRTGMDFFVSQERLYFMIPAIRQNEPYISIDASEPSVHGLIFQIAAEGEVSVVNASPVNPLTGKFETVSSEFYTDGIFDLEPSVTNVRFTEMAALRMSYVDGRGNLLSKSAVQTMINAEANRKKNIVKVRATVDGAARLAPRQMVLFLNVGARFRGPYYITRVRHNIEGQKFVTTFEGSRATTGQYRRALIAEGDTVGGTPDPLHDVTNQSTREEA
jgi:phage protein D